MTHHNHENDKWHVAEELNGRLAMLGIIAAIVLTYRKNPDNKFQNPSKQIEVSKKDRLKVITGLKE